MRIASLRAAKKIYRNRVTPPAQPEFGAKPYTVASMGHYGCIALHITMQRGGVATKTLRMYIVAIYMSILRTSPALIANGSSCTHLPSIPDARNSFSLPRADSACCGQILPQHHPHQVICPRELQDQHPDQHYKSPSRSSTPRSHDNLCGVYPRTTIRA